MSFTIPISVKGRTQRTLKFVGYGFKSMLTTKISGRLVIRKKAKNYFPPTGPLPTTTECWKGGHHQDWSAEHDRGWEPPVPELSEDIHADLVPLGIKVRDFAYPATRVGHQAPVDPRPMAWSEEEKAKDPAKKDIPDDPDVSPMPCVSMTCTKPHPSIRPLPKREWTGVLEPPTPENPYIPVYPTHRIPGWFEQSCALSEVEYRLSQTPRTYPICGSVTRRLLTLSPDLVDLTRYAEMDLEELRRYDRGIIWQGLNGIEPYPWRALHHPAWCPSPENRKLILEKSASAFQAYDQHIQHSTFIEYGKERRYDAVREQRRRAKAGSPYDQANRDGVTIRQFLADWERHMDTDLANPEYASNLEMMEGMKEYDLANADTDADTEMMDVKTSVYTGPAVPWAPEMGPELYERVPPTVVWGPNGGGYDGYHLHSGTPTTKTLNEYLAELYPVSGVSAPWPAADAAGVKHDYFRLSPIMMELHQHLRWVPGTAQLQLNYTNFTSDADPHWVPEWFIAQRAENERVKRLFEEMNAREDGDGEGEAEAEAEPPHKRAKTS
ncbi:hypothetical protein C8R43DRAFT_1004866 [Mycena crocata]|nr:hypothetical protein C8R43DRAFT_1004866 [Mycena crocata]